MVPTTWGRPGPRGLLDGFADDGSGEEGSAVRVVGCGADDVLPRSPGSSVGAGGAGGDGEQRDHEGGSEAGALHLGEPT